MYKIMLLIPLSIYPMELSDCDKAQSQLESEILRRTECNTTVIEHCLQKGAFADTYSAKIPNGYLKYIIQWCPSEILETCLNPKNLLSLPINVNNTASGPLLQETISNLVISKALHKQSSEDNERKVLTVLKHGGIFRRSTLMFPYSRTTITEYAQKNDIDIFNIAQKAIIERKYLEHKEEAFQAWKAFARSSRPPMGRIAE